MDHNVGLMILFKSATRDIVTESLKWLLYNAIGGLLPLWGTWLLLLLFSKQASVDQFIENGEFAVYSAALLMPAFFLILHDKALRFAGRHIFGLAAIALLILATLIYGALSSQRILFDSSLEINKTFLLALSVFLLLSSLAVAFLTNLIDNIISQTNPTTLKENMEKDFEGDFDELGE